MSETNPANENGVAVPLWLAVFAQLLCWGMSLAAVVAYVVRSMPVIQDFGIELTPAQTLVISAVDWIVAGWFIALPILAATVIGVNWAAFARVRSNPTRWIWTVLACVVPLIVSGTMFLTIHSVLITLIRELGER